MLTRLDADGFATGVAHCEVLLVPIACEVVLRGTGDGSVRAPSHMVCHLHQLRGPEVRIDRILDDVPPDELSVDLASRPKSFQSMTPFLVNCSGG